MRVPHRGRLYGAIVGVVALGLGLGALGVAHHTAPRPRPAAPVPVTGSDASVARAPIVATPSSVPEAIRDEVCNGVDDDRDGTFDEGCACARHVAYDLPAVRNAGVNEVVFDHEGGAFAFGRDTVLRHDGTSWRSLPRDARGVLGVFPDESGATIVARTGTWRWDGRRLVPGAAPDSPPTCLQVAGATLASAFALTSTGLFRRDAAGWELVAQLALPRALHVRRDTAFVIDGTRLLAFSETGLGDLAELAEAPVALFARSPSEVYVVSGGKVYRYDGAVASLVLEEPGLFAVDVAGAEDGAVRVLARAAEESRVLVQDGARWTVESSSEVDFAHLFVGPRHVLATTPHGDLYRFEDGAWSVDVPVTQAITDAAGASGDDVLFVGEGGFVRHYDGRTYRPIAVPGGESIDFTSVVATGRGTWLATARSTRETPWRGLLLQCDTRGCGLLETFDAPLNDVWRADDGTTFVVGMDGLLAWRGPSGTGVEAFHDLPITSVWGLGPSDVYATYTDSEELPTRGGLLHFNGRNWAEVFRSKNAFLSTVWGTGPDDLYVGGAETDAEEERALALHWDGGHFRSVLAPGVRGVVWSIAGVGPGRVHVLVAAPTGLVVHAWDGSTSSAIAHGTDDAQALFASADNHDFVVGAEGVVRHRCGAPSAVAPPAPADTAAPETPGLRAVVLVGRHDDEYLEAYGVAPGSDRLAPLDVRVERHGESPGHESQRVALSPDGRHLAYRYRLKQRVRDLVTRAEHIVPTSWEDRWAGARLHGFSRDSKAVLYLDVTHHDVELGERGTFRIFDREAGAFRAVTFRSDEAPFALENAERWLFRRAGDHGAEVGRRTSGRRGRVRILLESDREHDFLGLTSIGDELAYRTHEGLEVASSDGRHPMLVLPRTLRRFAFSPSGSNIAFLEPYPSNTVSVLLRRTGRSFPVTTCAPLTLCSFAFLDDTHLLVFDGDRLLRVGLDGSSVVLRENVVSIAYAPLE